MPKFALITVPRAASQWTRDVLFHPKILSHVPGAVQREPEGFGRLRDFARLPDGACSGPYYLANVEEWIVRAKSDDRGLVILRDPRDVLVSWVYAMSYSHDSEPRVLCYREPLNALPLRLRLMLGIVNQNGMFFSRQWFLEGQSDAILIRRFEDLVVDSSRIFGEAFAHFGWKIPEQTIAEVLAAESFQVRAGGRKTGELNEFSHYRRGVAGDWRNFFDRKFGELFENTHPGGLVELGYETSDEWYRDLPEVNARLEAEGSATYADSAELLAELARLEKRNAALEAGFEAQRALIEEYRVGAWQDTH